MDWLLEIIRIRTNVSSSVSLWFLLLDFQIPWVNVFQERDMFIISDIWFYLVKVAFIQDVAITIYAALCQNECSVY